MESDNTECLVTDDMNPGDPNVDMAENTEETENVSKYYLSFPLLKRNATELGRQVQAMNELMKTLMPVVEHACTANISDKDRKARTEKAYEHKDNCIKALSNIEISTSQNQKDMDKLLNVVQYFGIQHTQQWIAAMNDCIRVTPRWRDWVKQLGMTDFDELVKWMECQIGISKGLGTTNIREAMQELTNDCIDNERKVTRLETELSIMKLRAEKAEEELHHQKFQAATSQVNPQASTTSTTSGQLRMCESTISIKEWLGNAHQRTVTSFQQNLRPTDTLLPCPSAEQLTKSESIGRTPHTSTPEPTSHDTLRDIFTFQYVPAPKKFGRQDDKRTFSEFVSEFRTKFPANYFDNEKRIRILGEYLESQAHNTYRNLIRNDTSPVFDSIVTKLKDAFEMNEGTKRLQAQSELQCFKQIQGEKVIDTCIRLEMLVKNCFPNLPKTTEQSMLCQYLYTNLRDMDTTLSLASMIDDPMIDNKYDRVKAELIRIERIKTWRNALDTDSKTNGLQNDRRQPNNRDSPRNTGPRDITCTNCSRRGHAAADCRSRPNFSHSDPNRDVTALTTGSVGNESQQPHTQPMVARQPAQPQYGSTTICYNCNESGHLSRNCPKPRRVPHTYGNEPQPHRANMTYTPQEAPISTRQLSDMLSGFNSMSMNIKTSDDDIRRECSGKRPLFKATVTGQETLALIDSGSQISTITVNFLKELQRKGVNVDTEIQTISMNPEKFMHAKNASGEDMQFLALLRVPVRLQVTGKLALVPVFVLDIDGCEEGILVGTNVFAELGIKLTFECTETEQPTNSQTQKIHAKAMGKHFIHGGTERWISVTGPNSEDYFFDPKTDGIENGVFRMSGAGTVLIKLINTTDTLREINDGETLGEWEQEFKATIPSEDSGMLDECVNKEAMLVSSTEKETRILERVINENLTNDRQSQDQVAKVLMRYHDVIAISDRELTQCTDTEYKIEMTNADPVRQRVRPVPPAIRGQVKDILKDLIERNIIEPCSSNYSSPVVLVRKKDGSIRFCIDYREVNKRIKADSYPLPSIDVSLQRLVGKKLFSTLDLLSGFWQIKLSDETKHITAFGTSEGLYQFLVLPFGLMTSPAVFQRMTDKVIQYAKDTWNVEDDELNVYVDDILIATHSLERHLFVLEALMMSLKKYNLKVKLEKCDFLKPEVTYLGHKLDADGLKVDNEKIRKMVEYPRPQTMDQVRKFLGLTGFYRKFICRYTEIARPLQELTSQKNAWEWNTRREKAFAQLKWALTNAPILGQPDFKAAKSGERPFIVYTDGSKVGVGGVLTQEGLDGHLHPLFFVSRGLSPAESNYGASDLERLAMMFTVKRLHTYLYGTPFVVRTDHQPLVSLFKAGATNARLVRWIANLQQYSFKIEHVRGDNNVVADFLSRMGEAVLNSNDEYKDIVVATIDTQSCQNQVIAKHPDTENWEHAYLSDPTFAKIYHDLQNGELIEGFTLEHGKLQKTVESDHHRIVVPEKIRRLVFDYEHSGFFGGHFGSKKIIQKLSKLYFWPMMGKDIEKWHRECKNCFLNNAHNNKPPPLKSWVSEKPYDIVGIDILDLGLNEDGHKYVLTVVDMFSKWTAGYPMKTKTAEETTRTFVENWVCREARWPKTVLSDMGSEFVNKINEEFRLLTGIQWIVTHGYNSRMNGATERVQRTIQSCMRKSRQGDESWNRLLPFALYSYNTSPHQSTGESPFFLLHAFDPVPMGSLDEPEKTSPYQIDLDSYKEGLIDCVRTAWEEAREHATKERERAKRYYDTHRAEELTGNREFHVGDRVYMFEPRAKNGKTNPKLESEYSGPYRVIQVFDTSALITIIGANKEPLKIQFDMLLKVPIQFDNEPVGECKRKKQPKKPRHRHAKLIQTYVKSTTFRVVPQATPIMEYTGLKAIHPTLAQKEVTKCNIVLLPKSDLTGPHEDSAQGVWRSSFYTSLEEVLHTITAKRNTWESIILILPSSPVHENTCDDINRAMGCDAFLIPMAPTREDIQFTTNWYATALKFHESTTRLVLEEVPSFPFHPTALLHMAAFFEPNTRKNGLVRQSHFKRTLSHIIRLLDWGAESEALGKLLETDLYALLRQQQPEEAKSDKKAAKSAPVTRAPHQTHQPPRPTSKPYEPRYHVPSMPYPARRNCAPRRREDDHHDTPSRKPRLHGSQLRQPQGYPPQQDQWNPYYAGTWGPWNPYPLPQGPPPRR